MKIRIGVLFAAVAVLLASASAVAFGGGPGAVRKQVEASMLVTGKIDVDSNGTVSGFSLDQQEKLAPGVVELVSKSVPTWKFEPVVMDGKPANVRTTMNIRLVARKLDDNNYSIEIRSAGFGNPSDKAAERARGHKLTPPSYPESAVASGVAGTVYLLVRAAPDGTVTDVIAEQVNLKVVASENVMEQWRRVFEKASVRQAKRWKFSPPTEGEEATADYFVMRVPVVFSLDSPSRTDVYGRWEAYVPGPRHADPWEAVKEGIGFSPDTLAPGDAYLAGSGLKLVTELSGT
jgi:hypothetical protein